jgi:hypothetical protein
VEVGDLAVAERIGSEKYPVIGIEVQFPERQVFFSNLSVGGFYFGKPVSYGSIYLAT